MEPTSLEFGQYQLDGRNAVVQVVLRLAMGDRYYGIIHPDASTPIGTVTPTYRTFTASDYTGVPVIERAARLLAVPNFLETNAPQHQAVLGSWGQNSSPTMSIELNNTDGEMSKLVGLEYLLGKTLQVFVGFRGLSWDYAQLRFSGEIDHVTLTRRSLQIDAEGSP